MRDSGLVAGAGVIRVGQVDMFYTKDELVGSLGRRGLVVNLSRRTKGKGGKVTEWVKERLGMEVDRSQEEVLDAASRKGILNCTRQWGKSTITAAKAVHQA